MNRIRRVRDETDYVVGGRDTNTAVTNETTERDAEPDGGGE